MPSDAELFPSPALVMDEVESRTAISVAQDVYSVHLPILSIFAHTPGLGPTTHMKCVG